MIVDDTMPPRDPKEVEKNGNEEEEDDEDEEDEEGEAAQGRWPPGFRSSSKLSFHIARSPTADLRTRKDNP